MLVMDRAGPVHGHVVDQSALQVCEGGALEVPPVDPAAQLLEAPVAKVPRLREPRRFRRLAVAAAPPAVFDPQAPALPEDATLPPLRLRRGVLRPVLGVLTHFGFRLADFSRIRLRYSSSASVITSP